jgi:protocatechuate 3,4-dioxygenase beta subunit
MPDDGYKKGMKPEFKDYGRRDWNVHPPYLYEPYKSSVLRSPRKPLVPLSPTLSELTGPIYGPDIVQPGDSDLTTNAGTGGEAIGERIIVAGRVMQEDGRPVANTLIEIWQANASGRYPHKADQHDAPQDHNFIGAGRCMTNEKGDYRFISIKPGPYPWQNHDNAWRPSHIHFSLFGQAFITRLVTQMFFPNDPLLPMDPIYNAIPDEQARQRLVAQFAHDVSEPFRALGYRFDLVLRGREETPFEVRK